MDTRRAGDVSGKEALRIKPISLNPSSNTLEARPKCESKRVANARISPFYCFLTLRTRPKKAGDAEKWKTIKRVGRERRRRLPFFGRVLSQSTYDI